MSRSNSLRCRIAPPPITSFSFTPPLTSSGAALSNIDLFRTMKAGIVGFHPTRHSLQAKPATGVLIPLAGFHWGDGHFLSLCNRPLHKLTQIVG